MTDKVEIAWAGSFYDDPATLTWTDVTSRAFPGVSASLGRDPSLDSIPQARRASVRLKSYDGALTPGNTASPYYPNVVSGVPIRTSKRDAAGTWWPVWYGLTDTFNPTLNGDVASYTVVDVQCVSAWAYLTQAGARRTYADRVVGDLAPAQGEVWAAGIRDYGNSTMLYVAGGVIYGGATNYNGPVLAWPNAFEPGFESQRWGFAWAKLLNTGTKAWSVPGASSPVVQTGGADSSGVNATGTAFSGGFASDRPGGQVVVRADGTCVISAHVGIPGTAISEAQSNFSRVQMFIGRPPTQLAQASVSAPTSTAGWTTTVGTLSLVAASSLAHLPRTTAFDPATLVTSAAAIDGPANAISLTYTSPVTGATLTTVNMSVVAGKSYGTNFVVSGLVDAGYLTFYNAANAAVGGAVTLPFVAAGGTTIFGRSMAGALAPTGAVSARVAIAFPGATARTVTVGCVGLYEADVLGAATIAPARYWPIGADANIWAWVQWPDVSMTTGTGGQTRWLHVAIDVTGWNDSALHMLAVNGWPGVAGKPVVWADNVRVTTGWSVSYPGTNVGNDVAHSYTMNGSAMGGGFGSYWNGTIPERRDTTNPSVLSVPAALLGASRYEVTPDDTLISRAFSFFGGRKSLSNTYATDTGGQMTRTLDQLGWPDALRDIGVGASTLATTWPDLSDLGDYSALIGDLTKAEYGWVDIGPDGHLVWKPRAWYGVGTATAVAHYTWRTPGPAVDVFSDIFSETFGTAAVTGTQYSPPLDVRWDDKDTANSVVVTNGFDFMTRTRQDLTAQRRGLRRFEVTLPGAVTQANIDEVADILAAVHAPGPRIESLVLRAYGPDDPMLAHILSRRTGDVSLVDLPQLPAPDLTVPVLTTSIEHTSDGQTWTARLGFGPCPIPASDALWPATTLYPSTSLYASGGTP